MVDSVVEEVFAVVEGLCLQVPTLEAVQYHVDVDSRVQESTHSFSSHSLFHNARTTRCCRT